MRREDKVRLEARERLRPHLMRKTKRELVQQILDDDEAKSRARRECGRLADRLGQLHKYISECQRRLGHSHVRIRELEQQTENENPTVAPATRAAT